MRKKIALSIVGLILLGVGYYTISPLFRNTVVDDYVPASVTVPNGIENNEEETMRYPIIATTLHPASGQLRIVKDGEKTYVRYEGYKTINGPDLFVYLSKDLDAKDFVDLGELRGTEGNINYEVPEGVDINDYRYVLTWCKQFGVLFNSVDLEGESVAISESEKLQSGTSTKKDEMGKVVTPDKSNYGNRMFLVCRT
jgi:Electron transfer DM13